MEFIRASREDRSDTGPCLFCVSGDKMRRVSSTRLVTCGRRGWCCNLFRVCILVLVTVWN